MTTTNPNEINKKIIEVFLNTDRSIREESSYPFIVTYDELQLAKSVNIPIYFKQPRDWLSSYYDRDLSKLNLETLLQKEYCSIFSNPDRRFKPIDFFLKLKEKLDGFPEYNLIYNNLIKCSLRRKPDEFFGIMNDRFNDLLKEEYSAINPQKSIFCIGQEEDYSNLMSYLFLNDIEIKKLTKERPYNIYTDFMGRPLLHTYHPRYWNELDLNIFEIIKDFIIAHNG